jgi:hypothetical protein
VKQSVGWNAAIRRFASNDDVAFGDINLSTDQIRGNHNPGAGGWPTIRYFNKETGPEGRGYVQKTSGAVCDELKQDSYMSAFITEAGNTSLCSIKAGNKGCSDREIQFIQTWQSRSDETIREQIDRLKKMDTSHISAANSAWIQQRIAVLNQLLAASTAAASEL